MKKECFTCANKLSRDLSKEEQRNLQQKNVEQTGHKSLFIPEMEFKCNVTGRIIHQTDPACEDYSSDKLMEDIRLQISKTAKRLREELNNKNYPPS